MRAQYQIKSQSFQEFTPLLDKEFDEQQLDTLPDFGSRHVKQRDESSYFLDFDEA